MVEVVNVFLLPSRKFTLLETAASRVEGLSSFITRWFSSTLRFQVRGGVTERIMESSTDSESIGSASMVLTDSLLGMLLSDGTMVDWLWVDTVEVVWDEVDD